MAIKTKAEILEIIAMDDETFYRDIAPLAGEAYAKTGGGLVAAAMLGYSNVCKNQCLYCGMRAANAEVSRYRLRAENVNAAVDSAAGLGFRRIFFVSGEDPKYPFADIVNFCAHAKYSGFWVSLGPGELTAAQFHELREVGVDEIVLKFEMADRKTFNRLNPSTDYDKRLACIRLVQSFGFQLASGNIIDYPGQTPEQLADDIILMKELAIHWAPVIPYLPVKNTPLAQEGGPGKITLLHKEIAILRLMIPQVMITAQQPGGDLTQGLNDPVAHAAAIRAGANLLFCDLLPDALVQNFHVIDNRSALSLDHIKETAKMTGLDLTFSF